MTLQITWQGRRIDIEAVWVGPPRDPAHPGRCLVFLHEGLGSVSMWRDFPQRLCEALGQPGLVFSRPGYGQSTPRLPDERWRPDFMHRQALEVLPEVLRAAGVPVTQDATALAPEDRPWLFGHSDGGSIALIHAAHHPSSLGGAVVLAPHILVEELSLTSIRQTRDVYLSTDLKSRLARHHADPDSAFWGWNDIWLDPAFASWTLQAELSRIRCPLLAIQGLDDEYGTLEQIRGIQAQVPGTELLTLPACGHSPHKDQPQAVMDAVRRFWATQRATGPHSAERP